MIKKFKYYLLKGDQRSVLAKKNIIGSLALKMIDAGIDFILVPISLSYLTNVDYGIWLTISSMVNWMNFFDVGISHGYRNKLAIALSENNYILAKTYTSTTYVLIGVLSIFIVLISTLLIPLIDWSWVLNVNPKNNEVLMKVMLLVIITFALRLTLNIITSVFLAKQLPFWTNLLNTIIKLITATGILIAMYFFKKDLFTYSIIFSIVPLLVLFISTMLLFQKKYKPFKPSLKTFEYSKIRDIMELGLKFFIIQLGATMLFMTDNIVISHFLSPAEVTPYQIAFKYFGIVLILFSLVISPYWSAITDAYAKNDFDWIKRTMKLLNRIWVGCLIFTFILLIVYSPVIKIWIGAEIEIPFLLASQWALFACLQTYNNIYTIFLNGSGKIYLQMITGIITLVINIPLSIFFATYLNLGSSGVLLATNCSILLYIVTRKIQYNKLINNKANGIWAK